MTRAMAAMATGAALGALAVVGAGCAGTVGGGPVIEEMHAHFAVTADLRRAAALGDLEALREAARQLARRGAVEGLPAESRPRLYELRQRAEELMAVDNRQDAAWGAALLAGECGACHLEGRVDLGDRFTLSEPPDLQGAERHAVMQSWGLNRLWEGVVGPSPRAWEAGVAALRDHSVIPGGGSLPDDLRVAVAFAEDARLASDRSRTLGAVLDACSACHAAR